MLVHTIATVSNHFCNVIQLNSLISANDLFSKYRQRVIKWNIDLLLIYDDIIAVIVLWGLLLALQLLCYYDFIKYSRKVEFILKLVVNADHIAVH